MSRDGHMAAVIAAERQLAILGDDTLRVLESQDQALAAVAVAVGLEPATTTGREAFVRTAAIANKLQEAIVMINAARDALTEYGKHF